LKFFGRLALKIGCFFGCFIYGYNAIGGEGIVNARGGASRGWAFCGGGWFLKDQIGPMEPGDEFVADVDGTPCKMNTVDNGKNSPLS
jgi:hypothetical protein